MPEKPPKKERIKKPVVKMTPLEYSNFLKNSDWESAKDSKKRIGYKSRAFYDLLATGRGGMPFIESIEIDVHGEKNKIYVNKKSLLLHMRKDIYRVKKEASEWSKKLNAQIANLPILEGMYPNG